MHCYTQLFLGGVVCLSPGTHSVDQTGLELRDHLPFSASQVLGLQACAATATQVIPSFFTSIIFSRVSLSSSPLKHKWWPQLSEQFSTRPRFGECKLGDLLLMFGSSGNSCNSEQQLSQAAAKVNQGATIRKP